MKEDREDISTRRNDMPRKSPCMVITGWSASRNLSCSDHTARYRQAAREIG